MEVALPEQLEETPEQLETVGGEVKQGSGGKTNHGKTARKIVIFRNNVASAVKNAQKTGFFTI